MNYSRKPLLNYGDENVPNIGTVIFLDVHDYSPSKCRIAYWRDTHPAHQVELVYGVKVVCLKRKSIGLGHGMMLAITANNVTRYYGHSAGNVDVDELLMPLQVIRDWEEFYPRPEQLHFPDLKWFEPNYSSYPRKEIYSKEELVAEIKRRLALHG